MAPLLLRLDRVSGHSFFPDLVPADGVVVDLGANKGLFSSTVRRKYGWRCHAVEPNAAVWDQIPSDDGLRKHNLAIGGTDGTRAFHVAPNSESSSLLAAAAAGSVATAQVEVSTLASFAARQRIGRIDLLKVDVEGAEIELFESLADREIEAMGQLCVEFHELAGLTDPAAMRALVARLRGLGFAVFKMSVTHHADVLFVNRRLPGASPLRLLLARAVTRNGAWAARVCRRLVRSRPGEA
jgi:FkbM family methyltransferase